MASLIITIISIALVAVGVVMAAYYGGVGLQGGSISATASAIVSEANQILAAERLWSSLNGQPDISGMASLAYPGMAALVTGSGAPFCRERSERPTAGDSHIHS